MTDTQLFYLTIMILLLIVYLIINKICETIRDIEQAKTIQQVENENIIHVDCNNEEDMKILEARIKKFINNNRKEDKNELL